MRMTCRTIVVPVALALAGCAHSRNSPFVVAHCPLPADAHGFPLSASSRDTTVDVVFLRAVARAVAAQWTTDPKPSDAPVPPAVKALRASIDHGESFGRGDWKPTPADTATVVIVYRSGGAPTVQAAHDRNPTRNDLWLELAAIKAVERATMGEPLRDPLPLTAPPSVHGSVDVVVTLGREPTARGGVARFSLQERPVRPTTGNRAPSFPGGQLVAGAEGDVMLTFIVRPDSTADFSTAQVLRSTNSVFAANALGALAKYRFVPAEKDCVAVPELVQLPFKFRIGSRGPLSAPGP